MSSQHAPRRRPSLASPLPPTPIVPSTPLPRANPAITLSHHYQLPAYQQQQQRPSTAPSTANPRALMKRLMAKPAPPSSSAAVGLPNDEQYKPVQELEISVQPPSDSLLPPNEFYKSIRALDLVGQTDISMSPCIISTTTESPDIVQRHLEPHETPEPGSGKKQRNVLRRRPSANTKNATASSPNTTSHYVPSSSESSSTPRMGQQILKDGSRFIDQGIGVSTSSTPTPTPSAATLITPPHPPPLLRFPCHGLTKSKSSSSHSTRPPTPRNHPSIPDTNPPIQPNEFPHSHAYWVSRDQNNEDGGSAATAVGGGLTKVLARTISGKRKKHDSDHQDPSYQELKTTSADKDGGIFGHSCKKLSDSPESSANGGGGGSSGRRFWKLMKKISVSGLREKYQTDFDDLPPPVPPLPNEHQHQPNTLHNSRSTDSPRTRPRTATGAGRASFTTSAALVLVSPPLGKLHKTPPPPSTSAQHSFKVFHSVPQPSGPRPSTTTRSSSHSSDVASSRFFNRTQSARSSTSSFGEVIPLPPLPKETKSNDGASRELLQQHIIPPSELIRNHSTSNFPTTSSTTSNTNNSPSMPIPTPAMEDDWTIVRSPSIELEALSLPPPPRQSTLGSKGVDVGRKRRIAGRQGKVSVIPASKVLKMVNASSEQVDNWKNQDESVPFLTRSDRREDVQEEKPTTTTTTKQEQEQMLEKKQSRSDLNHDSDRSQSPTIPCFSTSLVINSFPARRSLSTSNSRSPRDSGDISPTASRLILPTPPRQAQRPESRGGFERVRQHLFGSSDVREEDEKDDALLNPLALSRKLEIQVSHLRRLSSPYEFRPQQQQQSQQVKHRKHHRHSSGNPTAITNSRPTHTVASSISTSTPTSPIIAFQPHRRSMSFNNTSLPALLSSRLSTSSSSPSPLPLRSPPSPSSTAVSAPQVTSLTPATPTRSMSHHNNRPSPHLRSGFSTKKLSKVLFPSSPSASPASSRSHHPSAPSCQQRMIGTFTSRSISTGAGNNHSNDTPPKVNPNNTPCTTTTTTATTAPQRLPLTEQEKADKWNDLLARSARAGGTLHLAAGSRLLGSGYDV